MLALGIQKLKSQQPTACHLSTSFLSCSLLWWLVTIPYILKVISISTPDVSKAHTFTPINFWQPSLLFSNNIFNRSIYHLFCPGDRQESSLAPYLKSFNLLCVTINNLSEVTFISSNSKKLSISLVISSTFGVIFSPGFYKQNRGWINYSSKFSSFYWTGSDWINLIPGNWIYEQSL